MESSPYAWIMIVMVLAAALLLFKAAMRVVAWGFFALYFFIGFGLMLLIPVFFGTADEIPWGMRVGGAFTFAAVVVAIKKRILKIVTAAAVIGAAYYLILHYRQ